MSALLLLPAFLLDTTFGEPKFLWSRLPHPAVLMGRAVAFADLRLNAGQQRKAKGIFAMAGLAALAMVLGLDDPSGARFRGAGGDCCGDFVGAEQSGPACAGGRGCVTLVTW